MTESPWFVAPAEQWRAAHVSLDAEESHHALHVLRLGPGSAITVCDGDGTVARCSIEDIEDGRVVASILERRLHSRPPPEIVVYQAAPKGQKLDDVIERAAELGAAELWVFQSSRTIAHWQPERLQKLMLRWHGIACAAAKQSRSPFVMKTRPEMAWSRLVERVAREPFAVTLWEQGATPLRSVLPQRAARIAVVVGPEGGLTAEEVAALENAGAPAVSLGRRIFRTELAPVVAICSMLWHYGVIG